MDSDSRIEVHPDAVFTRLGPDSATVLNLRSKRYYTLEGTGLRIWELIEGSGSSREIVRSLTSEFEIDLDAAATKLATFIEELKSEGLVEIS